MPPVSYDICDPSIRCGADKLGALVFRVEMGHGRVCRVLTFSQKDAELLAREHSTAEDPGAEPSLFDGF
jgi:hypothetical protein